MISSKQDLSSIVIDSSSFRDPSGFIFSHEKEIYRAINPSYFENFSFFINSGLYSSLSAKKLIVKHSEIEKKFLEEYASHKVIKPQKIPFISYPYEWCFNQIKDAALLTLKIQKESLKHGMTLKDASAFNVQFIGSLPIFIDTLSFEKYKEGEPWIAYRQFCQHFLAPLALMAYKSIELSKLSQLFIDGISLELANTLLPKRSLANSVVLYHLHIHSKFQNATTSKNQIKKNNLSLSKKKLASIIEHLEEGIVGFSLKKKKSTWNNYNETHNYSAQAKEAKEKIISVWLKKTNPSSIFDLGCNTGEYSFIASPYANTVLSMDSDPSCIESLYKNSSQKGLNILPLVVDLTNPTPSIGWNNKERKSIPERGKADMLLALALVHHLRISNNTPFSQIAEFFSEWGNNLIVEFIPKEDSQIQRILSNREDIFNNLNFDSFIKQFETIFELTEKQPIPDSNRILCLFKKKSL